MSVMYPLGMDFYNDTVQKYSSLFRLDLSGIGDNATHKVQSGTKMMYLVFVLFVILCYATVIVNSIVYIQYQEDYVPIYAVIHQHFPSGLFIFLQQ